MPPVASGERRRIAPKACDICRDRKVQCVYDGENASCRRCLDGRLNCTFLCARKARGPPARRQANALTLPIGELAVEHLCPRHVFLDIIRDYLEMVYPVLPLVHRPSFCNLLENQAYADDPAFFRLCIPLCAVTVASIPRKFEIYNADRKTGKFDDRREPKSEEAVDRPEHRALIRQAGAEGLVLLKNDGNVLPIDVRKTKKIALLGPLAKYAAAHGGGSASLNCHYKISPYDAFVARLGSDVEITHSKGRSGLTHKSGSHIFRVYPELEAGCTNRNGNSGFLAEYFTTDTAEGKPFRVEEFPRGYFTTMMNSHVTETKTVRFTTSFEPLVAGKHYLSFSGIGPSKLWIEGVLVANQSESTRDAMTFFLVICFVGNTTQWETEGQDLSSMTLPADSSQDHLIFSVADVNANNIVVTTTGVPVEVPWLDDVAAFAQAWYAGQETGNAILDVLLGDVAQVESYPYLGRRSMSIQAVMGTLAWIATRAEKSNMWKGKEVRFLFGYGLSYTKFDVSNARYEGVISNDANTKAKVTARVKNTGDKPGAETVQVYLQPPPVEGLERPIKELVGFVKLELQPDEEKRAEITFGRDGAGSSWKVSKGVYQVLIATSSSPKDVKARLELFVEGDFTYGP
ncbi:glycosyl hydrolase family 3 C-terminal domain-containing protein [Lophiotrema nucula]|uniref:beta-glucosidase n=1 Tax=Lophiotrema nucula TaxID=690887 RepID=A0A6A5YP08_9PLEO|nr:glycosyl hydrolase family 3 C-terminal domain-containing protein [Lophiotrema nucula]